MTGSIDQAAIGLGVATFLGASIGFERQWRQRMAGLRTNTLVALATSFVVLVNLILRPLVLAGGVGVVLDSPSKAFRVICRNAAAKSTDVCC